MTAHPSEAHRVHAVIVSAVTEMRLYDLRVTVERIEGRSVCGLEVGDYFEVTESSRVRIPEGKHFCLFALQSVLPLLPAKMRRLPDEDWLEQDSPRGLPRSGRARDHAHRAHRRAGARHGGAHVARELGIGLRTDQEPAAYEAIARRAEDAGIDVLSVFHDLLYQPAIGPLLLMARVTERVRLGPAALNPFTLHPYEIAGQIAMLDAVSGGRAYLGLAKGAWLDRLGIDETRPLSALKESVAIIQALLAGDDFRRRRRALHARARHRARLPARPRPRTAPDRHVGRGHRTLGRLGGRRGQDRRHRERGAAPRRARLDRQPGRPTRGRLRHRRR